MLIFIVPYIFDFIAGVFTMIMMYRIAIFNDLLKEKSNWANRENFEEAVFFIIFTPKNFTILEANSGRIK